MNYQNCFWTADGQMDCGDTPMIPEPHRINRHGYLAASQNPSAGCQSMGNCSVDRQQIVMNAQNQYQTQLYQHLTPPFNGVWASQEHQLGQDYPIGHEQLPQVQTPYEVPVDLNQIRSRYQRLGQPIQEAGYYLGMPDLIDPTRGGMAIWKEETLRSRGYGYLKRVMIMDERGFSLYTYIRIRIPRDRVTEILSINRNLTYDQEKKWLRYRGPDLHTNLAIMALVTLVVHGKVTRYQVSRYNLQKKYIMAVQRRGRGDQPRARRMCVMILRRGT